MKVKQLLKRFIPNSLWSYFRKKSIIKHQEKIATQLVNLVDQCDSGELDAWQPSPKLTFEDGKRIIWQYWAQGFNSDSLPFITRICLDSVEKHSEGYNLIRLSDDNLERYIDIPDWLIEKRQKLSLAHFADIVRCMLLSTYGGLWLDSSVLLTGTIPDYIFSEGFFMYQRDKNEPNKTYWENTFAYYFGWDSNFKVNTLNGIFCARKDNLVIKDMTDMLLAYWKVHDNAIDYFFFQILFDLYIKRHPERNCQIHNDCTPHLLRQIMVLDTTNRPPIYDIDVVKKITTIHSLNYKNGLTQTEITKMFTDWGLL